MGSGWRSRGRGSKGVEEIEEQRSSIDLLAFEVFARGEAVPSLRFWLSHRVPHRNVFQISGRFESRATLLERLGGFRVCTCKP
jgi:hypothetical protein